MSIDCDGLRAKGMHLYVPYTVKATGKSGECCYFCGEERV